MEKLTLDLNDMFSGDLAPLLNTHPCPVTMPRDSAGRKLTFCTAYGMYASACIDPCAKGYWKAVRRLAKAKDKAAVGRVLAGAPKAAGWDARKESWMEHTVRQKLQEYPGLRKRLLLTYPLRLSVSPDEPESELLARVLTKLREESHGMAPGDGPNVLAFGKGVGR